jgi:L-seryl-tRNA(Ser) seleniumtransferase
VEGLSADALESRLRGLDPPVVARIQDDRVLLDLRTIEPSEDGELTRILTSVGEIPS